MFTKPVTHIVCCCGSPWQGIFDELQEVLKDRITFQEGLPSEYELKKYSEEDKRFVCVLDDLMSDIVESKFVEKLFCVESHHYGMTIISLVQNVFQQGRVSRTIALNAHYFILFRNSRNLQQIQILGRQIFGNKKLSAAFFRHTLKRRLLPMAI